MNKKKVAEVFLAIILLATGLYFYQNHNKNEKINEYEQIEQQRKNSMEAVIKGVEEIAAKTGLSEVDKIVKSFKKRKFRVIPAMHDSGAIIFESGEKIPKVKHKIGVIFLSQKDKELEKIWKEAFEINSYVFLYIPPEREDLSLLVLKENAPISKTWQSLLLILEIKSATYLYVARSLGIIKEPAYYQMKIFSLQNQVLSTLGGKKYEDILNKEMARIEKEIAGKKTMVPRHDLYENELAEIFGRSESEKESEMRAEAVWVGAFLNFYDKKYENKEEAFKEKLSFFQDIYSKRSFVKSTKI